MKSKKTIIILENEINLKAWLSLNKSYNSYNGVKFHLEQDKENPKIKHVIYTFNKDDKITKENKGKSMKQSEFQETVLTAISKINIELNDFKTFIIEQRKFNEEQRKFNQEQKNFNESFSKRLDSIEYRLTRLESFHEKDIDDYETKK
ncbi:hypothetical protein LQ356_01735 [Metamycoplasma faucium]|uniref:Uncharacterized protein n=1 Tax=Metamycoplasma faucium TaxID=56142 RepID=A0ABZ2TMB1_9BACT